MLGQVSGLATAGYAASFSISPKHDYQQYLGNSPLSVHHASRELGGGNGSRPD